MQEPDTTSPNQVYRRVIVDGDLITRPYSPPRRARHQAIQPGGHIAWLWLIVPLAVMVAILWVVLFVKWTGGH